MTDNQLLNDLDWYKETRKRLKKFLQNCPLYVQPIYLSDCVRVQNKLDSSDYTDFKYDTSKQPKEFVHDIWSRLIYKYPQVTIYSEYKPKPEDFSNIMDYVKALENPTNKKEMKCFITKVIPQENVMIITDMKRNYKFKSKTCLILFVQKLISGSLSEKDINDYFAKNCEMVGDLGESSL